VTGYQPLPLADGASVAQASAWRGKWADITGLYCLGNRYYDPIAGSWLSFDPEWNGRDPNGFSFCGGDSVNYFDPDGRCIEGAANYVYNGGVAGQVLRGVSSYLNGYDNSSAGGGYFTGAAGTIANELAGMSAPSTYVNGALSFGNNINTVYQSGGVVDAASYGLTSWNMGAVMSGAANQDQVTGQPVGDWYQRGTVISGGVAGTAGVASAGLGGITALSSSAETTFAPGEIMPNGQVAGMGPGAALSDDIPSSATTGFVSTENGIVDVQSTLDRIESGGSFPSRNDGSIFQNRPLPGNSVPELPVQPAGYYNEYVVPTPGVNGPGPMRIVTGQGGELYFTPDHYRTFVPLNPQ
jgi:RHS repeat-associated protein